MSSSFAHVPSFRKFNEDWPGSIDMKMITDEHVIKNTKKSLEKGQ